MTVSFFSRFLRPPVACVILDFVSISGLSANLQGPTGTCTAAMSSGNVITVDPAHLPKGASDSNDVKDKAFRDCIMHRVNGLPEYLSTLSFPNCEIQNRHPFKRMEPGVTGAMHYGVYPCEYGPNGTKKGLLKLILM